MLFISLEQAQKFFMYVNNGDNRKKSIHVRTTIDSAKKRTRVNWDKLTPRIQIGQAQMEK